jgi:BclB C-terminal domain-containing protein
MLPLSGLNDAPNSVTPLGPANTLTGTEIGIAQSFPRDCIVTSISGFFSTTLAATFSLETVTVSGQLYISTTPDNVFTPVVGTHLALAPSLTGVVAPGTVMSGILTGLAIPVLAGSTGIFVFSATADGATLVSTVAGGGSLAITCA